MTEDLYFLILVIASAIMPFFIHIFVIRALRIFKGPSSRQKGVILSSLFGILTIGVIFYCWAAANGTMAISQILWHGIYLFSLYAISAYIYYQVFNLSETARRIRILAECTKTGVLNEEILVKKYTCQNMVSIRLERLIGLGILRINQNRYFTTGKIPTIYSKTVFSLRKILFPYK